MKIDTDAVADTSANAGLCAQAAASHEVNIEHTYLVECFGPDGTLKWSDTFTNLVTTAGKNLYLTNMYKASSFTSAFYVGLVTGPGGSNTYAVGDTMSSHAGWAENATFSNATRPAFTPGSVSGGSVDNSASKAAFTINGTATIGGAFFVDNSTVSGTSGTLVGVGNFTGGDRAVQSGDTLNVTVTPTIS